MKPPFNDAKLGREALELKVLARLIDKDAERGHYFPNIDPLPVNDCCVSVSYPWEPSCNPFSLDAEDFQCTTKVGHVPYETTNINGHVNTSQRNITSQRSIFVALSAVSSGVLCLQRTGTSPSMLHRSHIEAYHLTRRGPEFPLLYKPFPALFHLLTRRCLSCTSQVLRYTIPTCSTYGLW